MSAALITLTTQVTVDGNNVTVNGVVTGGAEKTIDIAVSDPEGDVVYTGKATSDSDGNYELVIPLGEKIKNGTYTVAASTPIAVAIEGNEEDSEDKEDTEQGASQISATLTKDGNKVTITGTTSVGGGNEVTLYVTNPNGQLSYINQVTAEQDGSFSFVFPLTYNVSDGSYTATIGGTGVSPARVLAFDYYTTGGNEPDNPDDSGNTNDGGDTGETETPVEPEEIVDPNESNLEVYSKSLFVDADLTVTLASYVPKITGTISCVQGTTVDIDVVNTTDNTVIVDETVTYDDGVHTLNYTLPSLISSKDYTLTITSHDAEGVQTIMSVKIDTSLLLVSITGDIQVADNVHLDARMQTVNTDFIDKSVTVNKDRTISGTIPNIISNSSYHFEIEGYESYTEDMVTEIMSTVNPSLYQALKAARPELDGDKDGVITQAELQSITGVLDLGHYEIEKLIGLGQCKNITGLIVSGNKVTSLRPLSFLDKLEYVDARNNKITNISTMPQNLRYLNIDNNFVEGLQGLKDADNLEFLSAAHNKITSTLGIGDKKELRYLKLNNNTLTDISALIGCTKLVHADLRNNKITDITPVDNLQYIQYIDLNGNE